MPTLSPHHAFIKTHLPAWLCQAPPDARKEFRDSLISSNQSRHAINAVLQKLKSPEDFARARLREALTARFFGLLDDEKAILIREWKNHHLLGLIRNHARTTRQTLLEAALQNFEAAESTSGGMETGTVISRVTKTGEIPSSVSPTDFAGLCRSLDLGAAYLRHISEVLESPTTGSQVLGLFRAHEQHAFGVALHIAYMKQTFTPRQHLQLHSLQRSGNHGDIRYSHLTIDNVVLPNVLVIEASIISLPFILYTPEDPLAAFRLHRSLEDLRHSLAERLEQPDYLAFFTRLVPFQHQQALLEVSPAWIDYLSMSAAGKHYRASLKKPVSLTPIQRNLFQSMGRQRIAQIKNDARTLAVPTADVDLMSRQKRLQGYIDMGKSLLFFAASFIPIVGQVMLVITAGQLLHTIYDGFSAWSRGDSEEALNDLLDVVDNVAMAAATAGAIKTAGFATRLVKVQLRDKSWRLWHPDLAPYRSPKVLPDGLAADAQGMYLHEQQHYLKLDDHAHAVRRTPDGLQWQLSHPSNPDAYAPALLNNKVGGWRSVHETPQDWSNLKLIKRLGPDATHITEPAVEPILLLGGVDSHTLRQSYQDMVRPPPLLRETLKHFNLEQEINDFSIDRAEGKTVTAHSPFLQFHLVCSLPEWPANYRLKVIDERQSTLLSHGTGASDIQVPLSRFRKGELLHVLEEQLPQTTFNRLLPPPYIDYLTKTENLAVRLHDHTQQQKQWLFAALNSPAEKNLSPVEQDIQAVMPELSKSHLEDMQATLSTEQRQRLHQDRQLPPEHQWEANQYIKALRANLAHRGVYLDSTNNPESIPLTLYILEKVPGWPGSRKVEVYDDSNSGPLLGSIGRGEGSARHILIRKGEQYVVQDAQATQLHPPSDLFSALEHSLSEPERAALLRQSGAETLKQAIRKTGLSLAARQLPRRAMLTTTVIPDAAGQPLNPLFAEPVTPQGMTLRADGIHQTLPRADGSYGYYILQNEHYYQVKSDSLGWQLIDARSPFRAYKPYLRKTQTGTWEIDPAKGALLGGMQHSQVPLLIHMESSDEFESALSSSDYDSAEEGTVAVLYTPQELQYMRTERSYQYSYNYLRVYDRANNGRYPLRNLLGKPMRIRSLQTLSKSLTSNETFSSELIKPYIQWEGYERVARLYEDKLEVTPFTATHQKCPEESAMIGQATVITRKPIRKGEALGVYGGELIPHLTAAYRMDPYLLDIKVAPRVPLTPPPTLSGDNVLSRINTIFEYEAGQPVRQAATGYNVEAARFEVDTQVDNEPRDRVSLMAFFASCDIPAATELRWNYQYNEPTIKALFGPNT